MKGSGLTRVVGFRVRDVDSGNPIPAATLSVRADDGDGSAVVGRVTRVGPELFRTTLEFPHAGRWHVGVRIGGEAVVPTSFSVDVDAVGSSSADGSSGGSDAALWIGVVAAAVVGAAGVAVAVLVLRRRRSS